MAVRFWFRAAVSLALLGVGTACASARPAPLSSPTPDVARDTVRADSPAGADVRPDQHRYYTGKTYGSEAEFNPLTEVLNEGFDVLSTRGQDRHIFQRDLGADARNVLRSALDPIHTFSSYGWRYVLRNEWLPLSSDRQPGGGSWLPNYESHLFGSGMISHRLMEWYEAQGVPHPLLFSAASVMAAHFVNEIVENNGWRTTNEDATTDLVVFDPAGILLWNTGFMQRAFSGSVQLTNWAAQPSYNPVSQTLENTGQQFVLRAALPRTDNWRFIYVFGMTGTFGFSRSLGGGRALSVGTGFDAVANPIVDQRTGAKGATLRPKVGMYYDRDGSLLWSLSVGSPTAAVSWVTANVYPGMLRIGGWSPGVWMQLPKDGGVRFGLVSTWGVGLAAGSAR